MKRYQLTKILVRSEIASYYTSILEQLKDGDYVLFSEAKAEIDALEEQITNLEVCRNHWKHSCDFLTTRVTNLSSDYDDVTIQNVALKNQVWKLKEQNEKLSRYQALCHCGILAKDHGYQDGHSAVPMIEPCPNTEEVQRLRGVLEKISKDIYCDGPGCPWCESGEEHPITSTAEIAREALAEMIMFATKEGK
jgi:hypothetical protein